MSSDNDGFSAVIGLLFILCIMGSCISNCVKNRSSTVSYTGVPNESGSYSSNTQSYNVNTRDAWIYTKEIIRRELKAPSSAEFEFAGHRNVNYLGNKRYSFSSYVDSQNSFGAMIRTHFSGIIKETNSGWLIEELNYQ